jgi:hypothetical protein
MADIGGSIYGISDKIMIVGDRGEFPEAIPFIPELENITLFLPVQQVVTVEIREQQTDVIDRENTLLKKSLFKLQKT